MTSKLKKLLPALIASFALFGSAQALTLNYNTAWFLNQSSNPTAAELAAATGAPASAFANSLYKNTSGNEAGGSLWANYTTTYSLPPDGGTAVITWDGGAVADANYLMAKDGNDGIYIWDVSAWDGMETITIPNPWLADQDKLKTYSHVQFWGTTGTSVPDGGATAMLLGMGLVAMSFIARRRRSA